MGDQYILDENGNPKKEPDLLKWAKWFEPAKRHIGNDTINGVRVSTVFLGLDYSFGGSKPLLFETMIFGGKNEGYQERYSTKEEAIKGHKEAVKLVLTPPNQVR